MPPEQPQQLNFGGQPLAQDGMQTPLHRPMSSKNTASPDYFASSASSIKSSSSPQDTEMSHLSPTNSLSKSRNGSGPASGGGSDEATPSGSMPSSSSSANQPDQPPSSSAHPWAALLGNGGGGSISQIPPTPGALYPTTSFSNPNETFNLSKAPPSMLAGGSVARHPSSSSLELPTRSSSKLSSVPMGMSLSSPGMIRGGKAGNGSNIDEDENFRGLTPNELRELMIDESRSFESSANSSKTSSSSLRFSSSSDQHSSTSSSQSTSDSNPSDLSTANSSAQPLPLYPTSTILILDIRPSTSYQLSRLPGSINICAPSTLLKRAGIGVERLEEEMLSCEMDRKVFANWRKGTRVQKDSSDSTSVASESSTQANATCDDDAARSSSRHRAVVVLDAGTSNLSAPGAPATGGGGKCLSGVLKKFKLAGYSGELCWLSGGFGAWSSWSERLSKRIQGQDDEGAVDIWIEKGPRELLDRDESDEEDATNDSKTGTVESETSTDAKVSEIPSIPSIALPSNDEKPHLMRNDSGKRRASAPSPTSIFHNPFSLTDSKINSDQNSNPNPNSSPSPDPNENNLSRSNSSKSQNLNPANKFKKTSRHHSLVQPRGLPLEAFSVLSTTNAKSSSGLKTSAIGGGAGDPINGIKAGEIGGRSGSLPASCANPFFDNIRQNRELAHGITERIPLDLPKLSSPEVKALPAFLRKLINMDQEEQAEDLAQNFFEVEKDEQKRLMETMMKHASESGADPRKGHEKEDIKMSSPQALNPDGAKSSNDSSAHLVENSESDDFPFSISAALERGSQNRYNNIWPYEHSRIKLSKPQVSNDFGSDYLNANLIAPAKQFGSKRSYIATQAPLPSTFDAFWTAIWEQNVRVIVMLTREHEGGRLQAHDYWNGGTYGEWKVEVKSEQSLDAKGTVMETAREGDGLKSSAQLKKKSETSSGNGMFPFMGQAQSDHQPGRSNDTAANRSREDSAEEPSMIIRTFHLSSIKSHEKRKITQLHYIAWPDYHIPETPESLLNFAELASSAQLEAGSNPSEPQDQAGNSVPTSESPSSKQESSKKSEEAGPMLVHCSAGVGRTGTFIVIDAALEVLRKFRAKQRGEDSPAVWDDGCDALGREEALSKTVSEPDGFRESSRSSDGDSIMSDVEPGNKSSIVPATPPSNASSSRSRTSSQAAARKNLKRDLSPNADEPMNDSNNLSSNHSTAGQNPFFISASSSSSSNNPSDTSSTSSPTDFFTFGAQKDRSSSFASSGSSTSNSTTTSSMKGRDVSSPPPLRRNRSSSEVVEGADMEAGFFDPQEASASSGLTPRIAEMFGGGGKGEGNDPGTPSRAMGSLDLSPQLGNGSHFSKLPSAALLNQGSNPANPFDSLTPNPAPPQSSKSGLGLAASSSSTTLKPLEAQKEPQSQTQSQSVSSAPSRPKGNHKKLSIDFENDDSVDLIRKLVDNCREQRMSTVQTNRQYVCIVQAVVAGVLREVEREKKNLKS